MTIDVGETVADGLAGQIEPSTLTWEIIRDNYVQMTKVNDDQIAAAMKWLYENHGLIAESSGATPLAAVLSEEIEVPDKRLLSSVEEI